MKKFKLKPIKLVELLTILFMSAILIAVWVQVFSRFFMESIPDWTGEEATTFLMIWMVMLGAAVSMGYDNHIKVDIIYMILPPKGCLWVKRLTYLIVIVFFGILFLHRICICIRQPDNGYSQTKYPLLDFAGKYSLWLHNYAGLCNLLFGSNFQTP